MSDGLGIVTVLGCLDSGEKEMNVHSDGWQASEAAPEDQKIFAGRQSGWRKGLKLFADTLRSYASRDIAKVAAKMAEWKMRVDTPPDMGPDAVYMISQY